MYKHRSQSAQRGTQRGRKPYLGKEESSYILQLSPITKKKRTKKDQKEFYEFVEMLINKTKE
jgi:hypothetical protein